jgi:DDE_Tnp_1-associated
MSERIAPLAAILAQVPDPRKAHGRQYPWVPMLLPVVVGLLCGANSQRALARWGQNTGTARLRRLGLPGPASPSQPTLHRLLRHVDLNQLEALLATWLQLVRATCRRSAKRWVDGIALDGKTLRGARRLGAADTHLRCACGHRDGLVLGQVAVIEYAGELNGAAHRPATRRLPHDGQGHSNSGARTGVSGARSGCATPCSTRTTPRPERLTRNRPSQQSVIW